jgi:chloride channel 3/4/5
MMANNSPMEFLHQVFVKLGARYTIVTDADGLCQSVCYFKSYYYYSNSNEPNPFFCCIDEGVVDKKTWLAFLGHLEEKS